VKTSAVEGGGKEKGNRLFEGKPFGVKETTPNTQKKKKKEKKRGKQKVLPDRGERQNRGLHN